MTGCLYVSPLGLPAILADTRVTDGTVDPDEVTPGKIIREGRQYAHDTKRICRKSFILSDRTAIAVSGEEQVITEFIRYCMSEINEIDKSENPIETISKISNRFGGNQESRLSVIGSHIFLDGKTCAMNGSLTHDLPYLGRCNAIGSGSSALMSEAIAGDSSIRRFSVAQQANVPAQILGFCSAVNAERILHETNPIVQQEDWGHFLEYIIYEHVSNKWIRQPGHLYIYAAGGLLEDGIISIKLLPRFVVYDPGIKNGRIAACAIDDFGLAKCEWILEDVSIEDQLEVDQSFSFWNGWFPSTVTLTTVVPSVDGNNSRSIIQSLNPSEMGHLLFSLNENEARLELDEAFESHFYRHLAETMGFFHVPFNSIEPDTRKQIAWPRGVTFNADN